MLNILFQAYNSHLINPLSTKINQYVDLKKTTHVWPWNTKQIPDSTSISKGLWWSRLVFEKNESNAREPREIILTFSYPQHLFRWHSFDNLCCKKGLQKCGLYDGLFIAILWARFSSNRILISINDSYKNRNTTFTNCRECRNAQNIFGSVPSCNLEYSDVLRNFTYSKHIL